MKSAHRKAMKRRTRCGAVAVEMSLTLSIFLLFLFGTYELARASFLRHAAGAAAYEGARVGILPGASADDVTHAVQAAMRRSGARNTQITITPSVITNNTPKVKVTVRVPITDNTFFGRLFTRDVVTIGETELFREGSLDLGL